MDLQTPNSSWLERPLHTILPKINIETLLVGIVLVLAVLSRFIGLGDRVMSHDEVNHVVPTYSLYSGNGYSYDPVTHGPLQFHMMALSYFLLGDSDFSSRVPAALFSIATICVVLFSYRRYLGRTGALIAGFLFLISPFMMFYGRYARNEVFGGMWTVLMLYGVLRYLEKGERFALYLLTVTMAFHFTDKATSFIYNAQMLLFLLILFVERITSRSWEQDKYRVRFMVLIGVAILALLAALGLGVANASAPQPLSATGEIASAAGSTTSLVQASELVVLGIAVACVLMALFSLVRGLGWKAIRSQRTFDLIMLIGIFTLPQLSAFPVRIVGWDPLDYSSAGMTRTALFLVPMAVISVILGLWWKPRFWLRAAAIFYPIFIIFYTTFFTNGKGFFMGLVASLGYWLSQQGVQRGGQPIYFYALVQIPIYEYLAALGAILALVIGLRKKLFSQKGGFAPASQPEEVAAPDTLEVVAEPAEGFPAAVQVTAQEAALIEDNQATRLGAVDVEDQTTRQMEAPKRKTFLSFITSLGPGEKEFDEAPAVHKAPVLALLLYWSLTSLVAYSLAGEKMPWLTYHIAISMLLASGWALGYLVDTTPWKRLANNTGLAALLLLAVIITSLMGFPGGQQGGLLRSLLGNTPPFQGNTIEQLESTSTFVISLIAFAASIWGFFRLLRSWEGWRLARLLTLAGFVGLAVLTARAAYMASFINYDYATEFLVYAHTARGPKDILAQIEEISRRTTMGKDMIVAWDNEANYPYWWYLRDWPNKRFFGDKPTRDLRDAPVIVVGDVNYGKVEPIVKDNYISYEYMRLWWPMQDYWNLTWERVWNALTDSNMRQALINIWLNRDYTLYSQITPNKSLTLENWSPAAKEKLFIRKDVVALIWNYGTAPSTGGQVETDPYEKGMLKLLPDRAIGGPGTQPTQFNAPRGMDIAKDGTIYVADSRNHRIQRLRADGTLINTWGTFADVLKGPAPAGTLNEPWDVKVGPDGYVYVADTFNFRIQKFTADGQFVKMWGYFGQGEKPDAFWGPRGLAFDASGRLYVTDTGNKRVVVFTPDGEGVTSFGTAGFDLGQLDEPVGIAIDKQGFVFIADTWNQRIQVFAPDSSGKNFLALRSWDVSAWYGQSWDNRPFLAMDQSGNIYVTDPDGGRILAFTTDGQFLRGISDIGGETSTLDLPAGMAFDASGNLWVSDGKANRLLRYTLPKDSLQIQPSPSQQEIGPLK